MNLGGLPVVLVCLWPLVGAVVLCVCRHRAVHSPWERKR